LPCCGSLAGSRMLRGRRPFSRHGWLGGARRHRDASPVGLPPPMEAVPRGPSPDHRIPCEPRCTTTPRSLESFQIAPRGPAMPKAAGPLPGPDPGHSRPSTWTRSAGRSRASVL
jgi:hypothetical protein